MKLQRSKSHRAFKEQNAAKVGDEVSVEVDVPKTNDKPPASSRRSIFQFGAPSPAPRPHDQPLPSATSRMSFSRPRTGEKPDWAQEPMPEAMDFMTGTDTFRFPTPSPRLQAKSGSSTASPSPLATSSQPSPQIGVALGSPSVKPNWNRSYTTDPAKSRMSRPPLQQTAQSWQPSGMETPGRQQAKKSKSAWKAFGGLFKGKQARDSLPDRGRKSRAPPTPPKDYEVSPGGPSHGRMGVLDSANSSPANSSSIDRGRPSHSRNVSRGMLRSEARAEADRAAFMRTMDSRNASISTQPRAQQHYLPPAQQVQTPQTARPKNSEDLVRTFGTETATPRTPRLDVEIPDFGFERYSVMFEKLLEPTKPSLQERRQSKQMLLDSGSGSNKSKKSAKRLTLQQPANPSLAPAPPKRSITSPHLTSPHPTARPIKTPAPPRQQAPDRPEPPHRAATAPPQSALDDDALSPRAQPPLAPPPSPPYSEPSLPPTPTSATTTLTARDFGPLTLNPPTPPRVPPIPVAAPTATTPATAHPDASHTPFRVKSPEDLERQMVQVSVARQVSVSKARRRVRDACEVRQPLRPRVVDLGRSGVRKSTVVLIEGGE